MEVVFRQISMALLYGPDSLVLSVREWAEWEQSDLNEASALGVVIVLVMGVLIFAIQRVGGVRLVETQ